MNAQDILNQNDPENLQNISLEQGRMIQALQQKFIEIGALSEVTPNLGTQVVELLVAPAYGVEVLDPTDAGFTGVFICGGEGLTFDGTVYHWGIVNAGVLQVGGNDVAKFLAGAGAVTLDADGVNVQAKASGTSFNLPNSYKFSHLGSIVSYLQHFVYGGFSTLRIIADNLAANISTLVLVATSATQAQVQINANDGAGNEAKITLYGIGATTAITIDGALTINSVGANADTIIKGDTTNVLTVDASAEKAIITNLDVTGTGGNVMSGTYTPSLTNVTNVAASTAFVCQYMRVGSVVTVSGQVSIDPTATGAIELGMSLPVASNFANNNECGGTFANQTTLGSVGRIQADTTNNRASFFMLASDAASRGYSFTFTYLIA